LRAANAEINQLVLSISSILVGINEKDRIFQWNPTAEKTLGIVAKDAIGKSMQELNAPWDIERILEGIKQCKKKDHPIRLNDLRFERGNGKDGFLSVSISPIQNYIGSYSGLILLGEDLTDHKLLHSQLAQAQKLESVGQLAAGIAHEINTPTQYIGDNVRFLQNAFRDFCGLFDKYQSLQANQAEQQKFIENLQEISAFAQQIDVNYLLKEIPNAIQETLEGVERVTKIVRAMKEFSHPGTENKKEIDINKAIESTITVARNEWKYVADVETDFAPHFPLVPCLPGEFNQVILNLLINAAHAITDVVGSNPQQKGKIKISTHGNGKWAEIRISDTGSGIPESIRAKVFDPFFTTKEVGKGTGQGLSIAHSIIVDKHHGEIKFDTEVGKGTTFIINLPLSNHLDEVGKSDEEANTFCG